MFPRQFYGRSALRLPERGLDWYEIYALPTGNQCGQDALFNRTAVMSDKPQEKTYSENEIKERLAAEIPLWTYEGGWIRRTFKTAGWKGTLMVINTVGHLAEAAWHHPDITASYAWVEVRLQTHTAKGITDKDFTLAKKIEDVVQWQPGKDGGALEGTPEDPRFAYIKYGK
jgi:4a-hydroxytetrahydrobiopterin dehydratase